VHIVLVLFNLGGYPPYNFNKLKVSIEAITMQNAVSFIKDVHDMLYKAQTIFGR
jgi:hypothetical protein